MTAWIKRVVVRLAMVPAEPHVPEGLPESVRVFHPGRNYFRWRILLWLVASLFQSVGLSAALAIAWFAKLPPTVRTIWLTVAVLAAIAFLISLPFTYLVQRLNYEMRWYIVTDRSLRIRSGIVSVQELTMTFANIQEIRVAAGPLQKILGLADVEVHSAGGSAESAASHVGKFEGLDNANAIRDLMVERLRIYKDSGLGDHAGIAPAEAANHSSDALEEARHMLEEVRALRRAYGISNA
jgi:membrane protein YdbS with pleckstrin-like domain